VPIDRSKYHPDHAWYRRLIRLRAADRCEQCGQMNGIRNERGVLVQCQLAHLDQNIHNNRFENLAWLCRRCHLNHDRPFNNPKISYTRKYGKLLGQLKLPFQLDVFARYFKF